MDILQSDLYCECLDSGDINSVEVHAHYKKLCSRAAAFEEDPHSASNMTRSLGEGRLSSSLSVLVKSHKDIGTFRAVHGSSKYAFQGLARWLVGKLRVKLQSLPHLSRDSLVLVDHLSNLSPECGSTLSKIDITDFYLQGDILKLVEGACAGFIGAERSLVFDVVYFLVYH